MGEDAATSTVSVSSQAKVVTYLGDQYGDRSASDELVGTRYVFDGALGHNDTTEDVFQAAVSPLVDGTRCAVKPCRSKMCEPLSYVCLLQRCLGETLMRHSSPTDAAAAPARRAPRLQISCQSLQGGYFARLQAATSPLRRLTAAQRVGLQRAARVAAAAAFACASLASKLTVTSASWICCPTRSSCRGWRRTLPFTPATFAAALQAQETRRGEGGMAPARTHPQAGQIRSLATQQGPSLPPHPLSLA
jgi:hypothetical protein